MMLAPKEVERKLGNAWELMLMLLEGLVAMQGLGADAPAS